MSKSSPAGPSDPKVLNLSVRLALMLPIALLLLGPEGDSCRGRLGTPCISDEHCPFDQVCVDNRCAEPPACVCPDIYAPVCGVDGNTYGNDCEARCAGVEVAYEGECACVCPDIYAPVCGVDGNTYGNDCEARCAGVEIAHEGECRDTSCSDNADCEGELVCYPPTKTCEPACVIACLAYDPVCGTDGVTYACGEQDAWCHGVEVAHDGECEVCICTTLYAPVCGVDGKTYGNACNARCVGVEVAYEGPCSDGSKPCKPEECGPGLGAPNFTCEDGTIGGPGPCVRNEDGRCAWTYLDCPPA